MNTLFELFPFELFLQQTITFAAIMDPIGASVMMLAMLPHQATHSEVGTIAKKATLTILIAFVVVMTAGDFILRMFGIDENSLKVIGGIVLLMMAMEMLDTSKDATIVSSDSNINLGVIPMGIPILFGAGLFTTIIIFKQQATSMVDIGITVAAFGLNAVVIYLTLKYSIVLGKAIGKTAEDVVTKLMGLIVGAISVQFIVSGVVVLGKQYL